jgi:hypothetical protein
VCHQTVSDAPPDSVRCTREPDSKLLTFEDSGSRSAIIHRIVRCSTGLSGVAPDCPVRQRSNGYIAPTVVCKNNKCATVRVCARRSQDRCQKAHRTVNSDCPVAQKSEAPTVRIQRPGDVAGAPDSVRWRTGLSGAPCDSSLHQRLLWWLGL